jgi:putative FmdB family regulatory protein
MPLYEYACADCQHTFEELVFGNESVDECPECRGKHVERLLSVPARPQSTELPLSCRRDAPPCGAPNCCRL